MWQHNSLERPVAYDPDLDPNYIEDTDYDSGWYVDVDSEIDAQDTA